VSNEPGTNEANAIPGNEQNVDNSGGDSEPCENAPLLQNVEGGTSETLQLPTATPPLPPTAPDASPVASRRKSDPSSAGESPESGYSIFIDSFIHSYSFITLKQQMTKHICCYRWRRTLQLRWSQC